MTTDRANQTIVLRDERRLGYAEYGDASGNTVFHFNGSGGSRLEHPTDLSILTDLGIRLISTDRPGHGISDPQPGRKLLDWPDDVGQLADHMGVDQSLERTQARRDFVFGVAIVCHSARSLGVELEQ